VAGKVEPIFIDAIEAMPQAIIDNALGDDVVLCMGAGSIGSVPQRVTDMLQKNERLAPESRAL
jgi:UDP-N-acetylmuramate--alanine ligase